MNWVFDRIPGLLSAPVVVVIGPTAIGKSTFSVDLARRRNAEIVSADSVQVYRTMDIGSAKVSKSILNEIPHHLIDIKNPDESYSMGEFLASAESFIRSAHHGGGAPIIICGGTGLYIHSLLFGYRPPDVSVDPDIRQQLRDDLGQVGSARMWQRLNELDSNAAELIHPNHSSRVVRALELLVSTGQPLASLKDQVATQRSDIVVVGLRSSQSTLWRRIDERVTQMITNGLIEEVRGLVNRYSADLPSMQSLGYKETVAYLNGKLRDVDLLNETIYLHTRQFAKRQMTWFKRLTNVYWIELD